MHTRRDQGNEDREDAGRSGRPRRSWPRCRCRARAARQRASGAATRAARRSRPRRRRPRSARGPMRRRPARPLDERSRRSPAGRRRRGRPPTRRVPAARTREQRRLEAREGEVEPRATAVPRGKGTASGSPLARERVDRRRRPDSRSPSRRAPLSNASPGGVVERRAEHGGTPRVRHVEQQRVAAGGEQAEERRLDRVGARKSEATWPWRWSTGAERQAARVGERLGRREPDEERADQPRALRDGDRATSASVAPASPSASRTTGSDELEVPSGRDLGHDAAVALVEGGLRRDDVREDPPVRSTSAPHVSSQDVSMPRIIRPSPRSCASASDESRVPPHDQGVLAVVRVVAAADARGDEAEPLVEPDRAVVRDADLERVAPPLVARCPRRAARAALGPRPGGGPGVDGDVHDVPRVDVAGDDEVADERAVSPSKAPSRASSASRSRPRTSCATTASGTTPLDPLDASRSWAAVRRSIAVTPRPRVGAAQVARR